MTQDDAFKILTMGKNVFLTGAAGSGKTFLLNKYIKWLNKRGITPAITASTGIASTHIGGQTIHSWSGIGIKNKLTEYDIDRIQQNERLVKRFQNTQVLIIDEISMLSADTLNAINEALQAGLQTYEPFGGMQVVFCGDFFQLPPVSQKNTTTKFAFQSSIWKDLKLHACYLTEQYRQNDTELLDVLNAIRNGKVTNEIHSLVESRVTKDIPENIPHLYTHNVNVDKLNEEKLSLIKEPLKVFKMKTKGSKKRVEILKKSVLVPESLTLKKGASVMFAKNNPNGDYVNGTLGTVIDFSFQNPIVQTTDGTKIEVEPLSWEIDDGEKVLAEITQIPLRLAWAVTIHKSQGVTLDAAYIDLTKTFVAGQGYVALSRVKTLNGLFLKGINKYAYSVNPLVFDANISFLKDSKQLERRLKKTPNKRIEEISQEFIFKRGGHKPTEKKDKNTNKKIDTYQKTKLLIKRELSIEKIAKARKLTEETVLSHTEELLQKKEISNTDIDYIRNSLSADDDTFKKIASAFAKTKEWKLTPVKKKLKNKYSYKELRLARLFLRPWGKE